MYTNTKVVVTAFEKGMLEKWHNDVTRIYKSSTTRVVKENGMDYVEPIAYTEEEASKLKMAYITLRRWQ